MKITEIVAKSDLVEITDYEHQLSASEFNAVVEAVINILGEQLTEEEYNEKVEADTINPDKYYYIVEPEEEEPIIPGPDINTPEDDPTSQTITIYNCSIDGETLTITSNASVSGDTLIITTN